MENVHIYLAGAMAGLSLEDQLLWRDRFREDVIHSELEPLKKPVFFSPPEYYSPETAPYICEPYQREAMEFDLYNLRKSDLVVVNLEKQGSIGTTMELALAKEYRIPVVAFFGINGNKNIYTPTLHPWIRECCTRLCDSMDHAVDYVVEYFLK